MTKTPLARDLMSRPVRQLTACTPVRDAAAFLVRQGISGAPVIDEHGRWVGVFTLNDLARVMQRRIGPRLPERSLETREVLEGFSALSSEALGDAAVRYFMTPGMLTVFPEATLEEVVNAMINFKVHRMFVIEEKDGELQGVITSMDVLRWMSRQRDLPRKNRKTQRV